MMGMMQTVISDDKWWAWEPLIEAVQSKGKTPPRNLCLMVLVIFRRHQNGEKWRPLSLELGSK